MTPLYGHVSPETAYVVDDYPYGFRLRCKIRYWFDHHPKKGYRFVSQTTNPKVPGEVWNKPKASTYSMGPACMFINEEGHVSWTNAGLYSGEPSRVSKFLENFPGTPKKDLASILLSCKLKAQRLIQFADGQRFFTINGEKQERLEAEIERYRKEAAEWQAIADGLMAKGITIASE